MIQLLRKDYDFTPLYEGNVSEVEVIIPHDLSCYQMTLGGDKQYLKYLVRNNDSGIALFIVSKEVDIYRITLDDSDFDFGDDVFDFGDDEEEEDSVTEQKEGETVADNDITDNEREIEEIDNEGDAFEEVNEEILKDNGRDIIIAKQLRGYYNNDFLGYSHFEEFIENLFRQIIYDLLVEVNILNIWEAERYHFHHYPFFDVDDFRSDYTRFTVMCNSDSLFLDYGRGGGRLLTIDEWFRNSDECLIGMLEEAIKKF